MNDLPVLGMPTLLELPNLSACADMCASLSLQFIELNMNLPDYQTDAIDEAQIAALREKRGLFCTLHLDERFDACDFNPHVRAAYLRTALDAIALARRHAMPIINMHLHSGVSFRLPTRKASLYAEHEGRYLAAMREFRDRCAEAIADSGVRICVENCDGFPAFAQKGIELLLACDAFGLTLDIGHDCCAGNVDAPFIQSHADRLWHMHIHDARGADCHLPFGEGVLDIPAALQSAAAHGRRAVIEVKSVEGLRRAIASLPA